MSDAIDFRIEDSICVNNDRNDDSKIYQSIDSCAEFLENPLDA